MMKLNFYCDESGHLEKDLSKVMVLGSTWCPADKSREIAQRLREIKIENGLSPDFELKWSKVSPAKLSYYMAVVDYFFDDHDINFRAVVIPDKSLLDHANHNQDHNTWYYKMYYVLLRTLIDPEAENYIYLDIKDTRGGEKINKLRQVLQFSSADFDRNIIKRIQQVRSHEVEQVQLADLLIGAISYANRGFTTNEAKLEIISRIRQRSGLSLLRTTLFKAKKINLLVWEAS
jgi:hypothetical protein